MNKSCLQTQIYLIEKMRRICFSKFFELHEKDFCSFFIYKDQKSKTYITSVFIINPQNVMNKIKGLLTATKENEEASIVIQSFNTRIHNYQKIIKRVTQVFNKVFIDSYVALSIELSKINKGELDELKVVKNKPEPFLNFLQAFLEIQKSFKNTSLQIKNFLDEGIDAIFEECNKISKLKDNLYDKLGFHEMKQNQLIENCKKYAKIQKTLFQAIESYKISFQDVKLIYNMDEKLKRYKSCSSSYVSAIEVSEEIAKNIEFLNNERDEIRKVLENFRRKEDEFVRIVGRELIKIPMNLTKSLIRSRKDLLGKIGQKLLKLKQKRQRSIFEKFRLPFPNPQCFQCVLKQDQVQLYPSYIANLKYLKIDHFGKCRRFLIEYFVSTRDDIKQRLTINESIKTYLLSLIQLFEKIFSQQQADLRDFVNEKYLKLIQGSFYLSSQLTESSLQKTLSPTSIKTEKLQANQQMSQSIVQNLRFVDQQKELYKNMNKIYMQHVKLLITQIQIQNDNLNLFKEQFKTRFSTLLIGKKQYKKDLETLKSEELQALSLSESQFKDIRQDILKKIDFIMVLVKGFANKSKAYSLKFKQLFEFFLTDHHKHVLYDIELCQNLYQKLDGFLKTFIRFVSESIEDTRQREKWFDQNRLYRSIVKENLKLKFDAEIDKVNEFKKLKKPSPDFEDAQVTTTSTKHRQTSNSNQALTNAPAKPSNSFQLPFGKNYEKFVKENTKFEQGQEYVSNFACGLCDNIIVSGRLYVTTNRLFFHSRFNSSNVFFGGTKLEIPKSDILKIEKKYNAIIFDNSISITTCNGEIFFTSLISRDHAYNLICQTFQIDNNKAVFELQASQPEISQEVQQDFTLNISQQDDLPDEQLQARAQQIQQLIENDEKSDEGGYKVPYQQVMKGTLKFPGFTAAKVIKIFESDQQFVYKNKTYENFWRYLKCHVHKNFDTNIEQWKPSLIEYINPSNIKKESPLKYVRKIETSVPAPKTSIPFMPKFITSNQTHELYLYSKDKFIVINKVRNSNAPYTDCFHLRYKKIIQKVGQDSVGLDISLKIIWVKKPMVQGMIEGRTMKQSIENNESICAQMQGYFRYLEQALVKNTHSTGNTMVQDGGEKGQQQQIAIESIGGKGDDVLQKQKSHVSHSIDAKKNIYKWGFISSIALNIILLIIVAYGVSKV